jgi:hypothetical protein
MLMSYSIGQRDSGSENTWIFFELGVLARDSKQSGWFLIHLMSMLKD